MEVPPIVSAVYYKVLLQSGEALLVYIIHAQTGRKVCVLARND